MKKIYVIFGTCDIWHVCGIGHVRDIEGGARFVFQSAVGWLAEGLGMLTGLDAIIAHNQELPHALSSFKRYPRGGGGRAGGLSFGVRCLKLEVGFEGLPFTVGGSFRFRVLFSREL